MWALDLSKINALKRVIDRRRKPPMISVNSDNYNESEPIMRAN